MSIRGMFKPGDIVLLVIILAIAVFWSRSTGKSSAEAAGLRIVTSSKADTVSLSRDTLITREHLTIEIVSGRAAITRSDCITQQCVRTGFIGIPGQMSACMPNGTWIEILGTEKTTDVVSY